MTWGIVVAGVVAVLAVRLALHRRRRGAVPASTRPGARALDLHGTPLVAAREIRERVRGRPLRIGSVFILLAVAAAIVIPVLDRGSSPTEQVGIVGAATPRLRAIVALLGEHAVVVSSLDPTGASTTSQLAIALADVFGVRDAYRAAHLSPSQIAKLAGAKHVPIVSLHAGPTSHGAGTSVIGVILIFLMLSQYNTWILLGVMEEKSSRVVEMLLATLRPMQLLAGKVLAIGLVAVGQATLIVSFALCLAAVVGSNLLHGTAPIEVASALLWLVLGYAFCCWAYAAAASLAERQDEIQSRCHSASRSSSATSRP